LQKKKEENRIEGREGRGAASSMEAFKQQREERLPEGEK